MELVHVPAPVIPMPEVLIWQQDLGSRATLKVWVLLPSLLPINILSKNPLLKYSIFQISAAFSQKCELAFHFKRWSEN